MADLGPPAGSSGRPYERVSDELAGTHWRAAGINDGKDVVTGEHTDRVTAAFGVDGTVSGRGGCNRYSGAWTGSGGRLTIGPVRHTLMACDALATEQAYFAALARVATYELEGDTLRLRAADGVTQVVLRRTDPPATST